MADETILIIDDSADTRLVLSLRLKVQGYRTVFAADALEAITMALQAQPDAILLDLGLPGSNGFLVLERLKAISVLAPIPVIIVSAEEPDVAQAKALASGAVAYLQKPVVQRTLVETVEKALAASRELTKTGDIPITLNNSVSLNDVSTERCTINGRRDLDDHGRGPLQRVVIRAS